MMYDMAADEREAKDDVLLSGFGLSGYRSFGPSTHAFAPLGKITVLAGQNNAGKSNVLRFMRDFLTASPSAPVPELDRPHEVPPQEWTVRLKLILADFLLSPAVAGRIDEDAARILDALREYPGLSQEGGVCFTFAIAPPHPGHFGETKREWLLELPDLADLVSFLRGRKIDPMWAAGHLLKVQYQGGDPGIFAREIFQTVRPDLMRLPKVRIIEAFRQIRGTSIDDDSTGEDLFNGVGLVKKLEELESPREIGPARHEPENLFSRINAFVQSVLDDHTARLRIPHDASTVLVARESGVLPLESLGTGVHQVVMIAAAATLLDQSLVGLEEPEVHLHPILQRRLVRYLSEQTTNQYVITTHSAHFLDFESARVFHLTYTPSGTEVGPAGTPHSLARVCDDLGYRPSDLLQSNAVIWVEGPSDRIRALVA